MFPAYTTAAAALGLANATSSAKVSTFGSLDGTRRPSPRRRSRRSRYRSHDSLPFARAVDPFRTRNPLSVSTALAVTPTAFISKTGVGPLSDFPDKEIVGCG